MRSFAARYFSGRANPPVEVTVVTTPHGLRVSMPDGRGATWPYAEVRLASRASAGEAIRFERGTDPPDALVVSDVAILGALREAAPTERARFPAPPSGARFVALAAAAIVSCAALAWLGYARGVPAIADEAARRVPVAWEERLGGLVREAVALDADRVHDAALVAVVDSLVARLDRAAQPHPYRFRVTLVRRAEINALAAPGGELVFFTGLVEKTGSPAELAGVLAHEMEHVLLRHSTRALLRRSAARALLFLMTGSSGALGDALEAAEGIGSLAYGRHDELEADREGLALLVRAGIDPSSMARMFETLERESPAAPVPFLSTHPATRARIDEIRDEIARLEEQGAPEARPIVLPEPWEAIVSRLSTADARRAQRGRKRSQRERARIFHRGTGSRRVTR